MIKVWFVTDTSGTRFYAGPFQHEHDAIIYVDHERTFGVLQTVIPVIAPYTLTKGHDHD